MWISIPIELHRLLLGEQALVGVEARLRLRVARLRRGADPLELAGERAAARRLLLLLRGEPCLLLLEPRRVVALERDALAAVELEDPVGDVVEEVAVVRDGDDGARVLGEEALEPGDRLGVEVVGRLVEEQQVRRLEQQPAERDAAPLAARERLDVARRRRAAGARPSRARASGRATHASARSICSCTFACSPSSASKSASGSANSAEIASKRSSRSRSGRTPSSTFSRTVLAASSSGSCSSRPTAAPAASCACPDDVSSFPAMIRSSVDLPAPFGPSTPIFAPGRNASVMLSRTLRSGP